MNITADTLVADIAREHPASIPVFQAHQIDFCCHGKIPLSSACTERQLQVTNVLAELRTSEMVVTDRRDWTRSLLSDLVDHIKSTYHVPLRVELQRLDAMMTKVVDRHGAHLPETLPPLQRTFTALAEDMLEHMMKEDEILFPRIVAAESGGRSDSMIGAPIDIMEEDHDRAGAALAKMRALTHGYAPPEWACPTFRGLYFGLAQFEATMHTHVHLENNILFPRALELTRKV